MNDFIGRDDELSVLDELWETPTSSLLILYGRRRVGKTRLLTHWLRQRSSGRGLYWVAEPSSQLSQLRSFSQALFNFTSTQMTAPTDFSYANWEQAFQQVAIIAEREKVAIFIDELGYLLDANPNFAGTLQNAWDHILKPSRVMMALSGSQMSVIQNMFSYSGPLYGRSSAIIELPQLEFSATREYFPQASAEERVHLYAIWGGVPAYWELLNADESLRENIRRSFLRSNMLMQQEPLLLLQDFMSDPHNYIGILHALASGAVTRTRIATMTGLPEGHMSKYLTVLRDTGFVDRFVPVFEDASKSRRGHYRITDPLFRFYYRFLPQHHSRLALGEQDEILGEIEGELPEFIRNGYWHELCQQWLLKAGLNNTLPLSVNEVGGAWYRHVNVPVVGIDKAKRCITFAAAIWQDGQAGLSDISDLLNRSANLLKTFDKPESWKVYFIGFANDGWQPNAVSGVEQFVQGATQLQAWDCKGVMLVDLEQVDDDLATWQEG